MMDEMNNNWGMGYRYGWIIDCPICNMHLVPVDKNGKHSEDQQMNVQTGHDHKVEQKKDKH